MDIRNAIFHWVEDDPICSLPPPARAVLIAAYWNRRNSSALGLCHLLAGASTWGIQLDAACESSTSIHLCQAHAGCRSGQLVTLYLRLALPPLQTFHHFGHPEDISELPICSSSAPQPVCSFPIGNHSGRLFSAPNGVHFGTDGLGSTSLRTARPDSWTVYCNSQVR